MGMIFLQLFTYLDISSLRALRALQALRACFGGSLVLSTFISHNLVNQLLRYNNMKTFAVIMLKDKFEVTDFSIQDFPH